MTFNLLRFETVGAVAALASALNLMGGMALPAIGTVAAGGSFRVDDATVAGNATLFEGTTVETERSPSALVLASGVRLSLGAESKGRVFSDRLVLERGSGEIQRAAGFRVEARGLTVRTESGAGSARVALAGGAHVQVAALTGSVRVQNTQGLLVAAIRPGHALEFAFQASGEQWKLTGCLRTVAGHYLVTDEVTSVIVEVAGSGLAKESGNRVEVTGAADSAATPASGASQYIRVSGLKRMGRGCAATDKAAAAGTGGGAGNTGGAAGNAGGAAGGAGKAASAGKIAGLSVATVAVIGGVAAAAVIGGLAATGSLSGSSPATVSR